MSAFGSILRQALWLIAVIAWWCGAAPADAETRVALVIGNGAYARIGALPNPPNDMALMAATLGALDFEVIAAADVDLDGMKQAIQQFGRRLEEAGPDTVALFFYAGHGLQANGVNFLVPIDAAIERETDIVVETINLDWVLDQMEFAGNRMNLVIIDACRNNPIVRSMRSGTRGLAQIDAPRGTLIAYATAPGAVAVDGEGANSPYSAALARNLQLPGRAVEEVFRQTRVEVLEATGGEQVPWESSSLTGAFYFKQGEAAAATPAPATAATPADVAPAVPDQRQLDLVFWQSIKDSDDPALFEDYLKRFPTGEFKPIALARRDALKGGSPAHRAPDQVRIEQLDRLMYVQERANIRTEPSADAPIIATLDPGAELQVTGAVVDQSWFRVMLERDRPAFVWQPLLGAAAPEVEVAAAGPPPGPRDLTGRWTGQYRCQQDVVGVTIDLVEYPDHALEAVFSFYPLLGSPSFPEGSFAMAGHVDRGQKLVDLKSTSWIERPFGLQRHDLQGAIDAEGGAIAGQILTTGCAEFALERHQ